MWKTLFLSLKKYGYRIFKNLTLKKLKEKDKNILNELIS